MGFILKQNSPNKIGPAGSNNTVWDDSQTPGLSVARDASAPDLISFLAAGNLEVFGFDGGATTEQVFFTMQLSHAYKEGTNIKPHVHWTPTTADAGNVKWQLEYSWQDIYGTFGAVATISGTGAAGGTAWVHNMTTLTEIDGSGMGISSILVGRLFRDPSDGSDTYGADAGLLSFDLHFEKDTIGSLEVGTKT